MTAPLIGLVISYGEERPFLRAYARLLEVAGGAPVFLPYPVEPATVDRYLDACDGIVATGGEDIDPVHYGAAIAELGPLDRERDAFELPLLRRALERDRPLLAICRGVQALNVAAGGTLYQDLGTQRPSTLAHEPRPLYDAGGQLVPHGHRIRLERSTLLAGLWQREEMTVNSYHHQAIRVLGAGLRVAARAADGVIEAVEAPARRFVVGVQWHPELLLGLDAGSEALAARFVQACAAEAARRRREPALAKVI